MNASLKTLEGSTKKASTTVVIFLSILFLMKQCLQFQAMFSYVGMESAGRRFTAAGKNSQHRYRKVTQIEVDTEGQLVFFYNFFSILV